jgi:hypothetical protein
VKILVDVNVYIDVLTKRAGWEEGLRVLNLVRKSPEVEGWASVLTVPLLYFFRLRSANEKQARADAYYFVTFGFHHVECTENRTSVPQESFASCRTTYGINRKYGLNMAN